MNEEEALDQTDAAFEWSEARVEYADNLTTRRARR